MGFSLGKMERERESEREHLACAASGDDVSISDCALYYHYCGVKTSFYFCDKLFGSSSKDQCARLGCWATLEEVEPLATNLSLFEALTSA